MPAAIAVEGLGKRYRLGTRAPYKTLRESLAGLGRRGRGAAAEFWALRDVSFRVAPGERLGIIGPNGAGKSTLLKILSRITEPTAGEARIRGRVGSLLEVGTGFHPELTGRENVFLNGTILGMRRAEVRRRFDEIVAFAEVERFLDTPVKRYSSGMYVRLAFAVAAHLDTEILFVDEVLAVGDAAFQAKCIGKMGAVASEGRTVVLVSHNLASIEAFCDRGLLLEAGSVRAAGAAGTVVETYLGHVAARARGEEHAGGGEHIRSVTTRDAAGEERRSFAIGEEIVVDVELRHDDPRERPRLAIGLCTLRGERILTLHTDLQYGRPWHVDGTLRLRARCREVRLVPDTYRLDVRFWGYDREIETRIGARLIEVLPRDVYGTGVLPDPATQGHVLPAVTWEIPAGPPPGT